jgi:uncharacterized protein (TIGR03437 family)
VIVAESFNRVALYFPAARTYNAANGNDMRPISPGQHTTLSRTSEAYAFSTDTASAGLPAPRELADVQVILNDRPLPLTYVSPSQINFIAPMDGPSGGTGELIVTKPSTGQVVAVGNVAFSPASPALFTITGGGTGQLAALNEDGSLNSASNAVQRGRIIVLFGTGQGVVPGAPPDGEAAPISPLVQTDLPPQVVIGTREAEVLFSGFTPGLPNLWQINARVPETTAPGATPVIVVVRSIPSNQGPGGRQITTTIAVR